MKQCSRCKNVKSFSEFNKNLSRKDGLRCWCKSCEQGIVSTGDKAMDIITRLKKCWRDEAYQKRTKGKMFWRNYTVCEWFQMLVFQKGRCAVSGVELTSENISIDHIIPVSSGGTHELSNLRLVAWEVNQAMNSLDDDDFIELCRQVIHHQLNILFYGDKKTSVAQSPTEAEGITHDADPDLE